MLSCHDVGERKDDLTEGRNLDEHPRFYVPVRKAFFAPERQARRVGDLHDHPFDEGTAIVDDVRSAPASSVYVVRSNSEAVDDPSTRVGDGIGIDAMPLQVLLKGR